MAASTRAMIMVSTDQVSKRIRRWMRSISSGLGRPLWGGFVLIRCLTPRALSAGSVGLDEVAIHEWRRLVHDISLSLRVNTPMPAASR